MSEKKKKATKEFSASADPFAEYQNKMTITFQEGLCYFLNSLFVAATPVYLFCSILRLNLKEQYFFVLPLIVITAVILSIACAFTNHSFKSKLLLTRQDAVSSSVLGLKKFSKDEKKKKMAGIRENQERITTIESIAFSILYNSFFFLLGFTFLSSYILASLPVLLNYVVSTAATLGLVLYSAVASTKS